MRSNCRLACLAAVVILAGSGIACRQANPAVQRSQQAAEVLVDTRQSLVISEQVVGESQSALRTLGASKGDLRPPFAVFVQQLENVRKQADKQRAESDVVLSQATAYVGARQSDIRTISNSELRAAAEQRTSRMQEQTQAIKAAQTKMNAAFAGYIRNLSDLQTYLANDLNYGALNTAQKWVEESLASGEDLRASIRDLAGRVELMSSTLSPVPIASKQWPATMKTTAPTTSPR